MPTGAAVEEDAEEDEEDTLETVDATGEIDIKISLMFAKN
jgi:hypothetical protein